MIGEEELATLLADPEALDDAAFARAIAALRAQPELRARAARQLAIAELASRALSPARQGFRESLRWRLAHRRPSGRFAGRVTASARRAAMRRRRREHGGRLGIAIALAAALVVAVLIARPDRAQPIARVAAGAASVVHASGARAALAVGDAVVAGDRVAAGDAGVELARGDGARLRLERAATLTAIDATTVDLADGALDADVPHPAGAARERLRVRTRAGDISVTGTRFAVVVAGARTALAMRDGITAFANVFGSIAVPAPQRAHAVVGSAPEIDRPFPARVLVRFGKRPAAPAGDARWDEGDEYARDRGYGWIGPKDGGPIPGASYRDDSGRLVEPRLGRVVQDPAEGRAEPALVVGWRDHVETWRMDAPDGRYRVTVRVGDSAWQQGPHHVVVNGVRVVDRLLTARGEYAERSAEVEVRDGRIEMRVGGCGAGPVADDGSSDTILVSLLIERLDG